MKDDVEAKERASGSLQRMVRPRRNKLNMKITRLRLTIEPWHMRDTMKELRVEAIVDGNVHTTVTPFEDDDFESRFEFLMENSKREILGIVKAHGAKTPNDGTQRRRDENAPPATETQSRRSLE